MGFLALRFQSCCFSPLQPQLSCCITSHYATWCFVLCCNVFWQVKFQEVIILQIRRYFTIDFNAQLFFYAHSESDKTVSHPIRFKDALVALLGSFPGGSNIVPFLDGILQSLSRKWVRTKKALLSNLWVQGSSNSLIRDTHVSKMLARIRRKTPR